MVGCLIVLLAIACAASIFLLDALAPDHEHRKTVIQYLDRLQDEYFSAHQYRQLSLKE